MRDRHTLIHIHTNTYKHNVLKCMLTLIYSNFLKFTYISFIFFAVGAASCSMTKWARSRNMNVRKKFKNDKKWVERNNLELNNHKLINLWIFMCASVCLCVYVSCALLTMLKIQYSHIWKLFFSTNFSCCGNFYWVTAIKHNFCFFFHLLILLNFDIKN